MPDGPMGRRRHGLGGAAVAAFLAVLVASGQFVSHPAQALASSSATEDPDGDGLSNAWEVRLGLDPASIDTDGDGIEDGDEDPDKDRLTNRFEVHESRTDPRTADTDLDGIRDGVEDPDGDGLGNAGEQLFGTAPTKRDTDGDRRDDWHEDANDNGRADGLEQDARAVPANLTPALDGSDMRPRRYLDCHQRQGRAAVIVCSYGHGPTRVVLFGDSHALQWRAALERVADVRHWHLYFITKSACPVARIELDATPDCALWRKRAIRKIKQLAPAMVVASNRDRYTATDSKGPSDNQRKWRRGLTATLADLHAPGRRVLLLGDTSRFGSAPECLSAHLDDISACSIRRAAAVGEQRIERDRKAAAAAGALYRRTVGWSCPYDPCPVVIDRMLVAYDEGHMTYAFGRSLWHGLARMLPKV